MLTPEILGSNRQMYTDEQLVPISALQHLVFCARQCALIHVERVWSENALTRDRPGRPSLALDLMEEFRPVLVDRYVVTLINRKQVSASDFETQPSGGIVIKDNARREILKEKGPGRSNCTGNLLPALV